ncbi:MAG: hypothetical protein ACRCWB_04080 [Enterovibrio sp.]
MALKSTLQVIRSLGEGLWWFSCLIIELVTLVTAERKILNPQAACSLASEIPNLTNNNFNVNYHHLFRFFTEKRGIKAQIFSIALVLFFLLLDLSSLAGFHI